MSEFGTVCERRNLRVNVKLNGEPLEEVDCYKYLGRKWQPMEDVKGMWYTE